MFKVVVQASVAVIGIGVVGKLTGGVSLRALLIVALVSACAGWLAEQWEAYRARQLAKRMKRGASAPETF